jgi:hypothetical protein
VGRYILEGVTDALFLVVSKLPQSNCQSRTMQSVTVTGCSILLSVVCAYRNGEPKEVCLKYTISTKEKPYYGELRVIIKAKAPKAFSSDKQLIGKIKLEELKE